MDTMIEHAVNEAWMDLFDARYWAAYKKALSLLGLEPNIVKNTRALDLMQKVIVACPEHTPQDYIRVLDLLIESGRGVGRELDALRVAWACIGVSELDWAPLELMVKLGEPTLSTIGRQGNANSVDNGTLSSISGTHLIAKQLGVARSILLGDQQEEQSSGVWGHLSKLSASFRTYPIRIETLQPDDKVRLQCILLGGLQRAAYHIRSMLAFRAIFHPAFTSPEDGISSLTVWDDKYFHGFRECWSHHVDYEDLFWVAFGHAVSNLKQRWDGFAVEAVRELCGVDIDHESFPEKMLSRISSAKKRHLFIDRCEKVIRLLNWKGKPAAARKLVELVQEELAQENASKPSLHTLFRAVSHLSQMNTVSAKLRASFRERLKSLCTENETQGVARFLHSPRGQVEHGSHFLVRSALCYAVDGAVDANERFSLAQATELYLTQLTNCWHSESSGKGTSNALLDVSPESRFELRFWLELANVYQQLTASGFDRKHALSAAKHVVSFDSSESETEERLRLLQLNCAEDEDLAMAPIAVYAHADTLVRIANGPKENATFTKQLVRFVSGGEVPLRQGEEGSPQSEKIAALKRLLPPTQFVRYMDFCVRGWGKVEIEYRELCQTIVNEVIRIAYDDICPGADRREFIRSVENLRNTIVKTTLDVHGTTSVTVPPQDFVEWLEILGHRLLIEEYLSNKKQEQIDEQSANSGDWGASEKWRQPLSFAREEIWSKLDQYHKGWLDISKRVPQPAETLAVSSASCVTMNLGDCDLPDQSRHGSSEIRSIADVPKEMRDVEGFRDRLACHLSEDSLWVKAIIDHKERVVWWAFRRNYGSTELACVASGQSERPFAGTRIELESLILDAKIDTAYAMAKTKPEEWKKNWESADPSQFFRLQLPTIFEEDAAEVRAKLQEQAVELSFELNLQSAASIKALPWKDMFPQIDGLSNVKKLAYQLLQAVTSKNKGSIQRIVSGWRELARLINSDSVNHGESLDLVLNKACATHVEALLRDFTLDALSKHLDKSTDVVLTLDGPLSTIPAEMIPIKGRPLCEQVNSVTVLLSTTLATSKARPHERSNQKKQLFAAVWDTVERRTPKPRMDGFDFFQAFLHRICEFPLIKESRWDCISVSDSPRATPGTIRSTLASNSFPIVAFGSHGVVIPREGGSAQRAALLMASPRKKDGVYVDESVDFSGRCDLRGNEAVIFFACLIARLLDDGDSGIRGMFTENILSGGRVFCGARWSVHTFYAPIFCIELIKELMESIDEPEKQDFQGPFRVARIVNRVRCRLMREMPGATHTFSAFTCFGLSSPKYSSNQASA